jgi:hypothetical protein
MSRSCSTIHLTSFEHMSEIDICSNDLSSFKTATAGSDPHICRLSEVPGPRPIEVPRSVSDKCVSSPCTCPSARASTAVTVTECASTRARGRWQSDPRAALIALELQSALQLISASRMPPSHGTAPLSALPAYCRPAAPNLKAAYESAREEKGPAAGRRARHPFDRLGASSARPTAQASEPLRGGAAAPPAGQCLCACSARASSRQESGGRHTAQAPDRTQASIRPAATQAR